MNHKRIISAIGVSLVSLSLYAQDDSYKLSISGFSELTFTAPWGEAAVADDLAVFEALGGDEELTESTPKVVTPGFNLIFTRSITDRFKFQGEIVNSFEDGNFEIELLRTYVDYTIHPMFNLQAGKFLSAIGYLNRNQRFYGYLNYSVQQRAMVNKEFGYVPLSTVGIKAYGTFELGSLSMLNYQLAYGGMRELTTEASSELISGFEIGEDESNSAGGSVLLEYITYIGEMELILGASAYMVPRIVGFYVEDGEDVSYGHEADKMEEDGLLAREAMELSEYGFAPYIRLDAPKFQFLGEYHFTKFSDQLGNLDQSSYGYYAYSLELVYKTELIGKSFYPYLRLDGEEIANGGSHPYYGLSIEEESELGNSYIPSNQEIIVGIAVDVVKNNRIKIEYGRYIGGPFTANNLKISTAFAF
jgi:hypothetical protein